MPYSDRQKIVGYIPHGRGEFEMGGQAPEYISLELHLGGQPGHSASREYFSITRTVGYIMSYGDLDKAHNDYVENMDIEDEYGYLWDERDKGEFQPSKFLDEARRELRVTGEPSTAQLNEIDEKARELAQEAEDDDKAQFFSGLRRYFEDDWPEPFELNNDIPSYDIDGVEYYATGHTWGAGTSEMAKGAKPTIAQEDFDFILDSWRKYHLKPMKEVPVEVADRLRRVFNSIDNQKMFERVIDSKKARQRRAKPGQQRLNAFRRPHPVVPVRRHLRRMVR